MISDLTCTSQDSWNTTCSRSSSHALVHTQVHESISALKDNKHLRDQVIQKQIRRLCTLLKIDIKEFFMSGLRRELAQLCPNAFPDFCREELKEFLELTITNSGRTNSRSFWMNSGRGEDKLEPKWHTYVIQLKFGPTKHMHKYEISDLYDTYIFIFIYIYPI